MDLSLSRAQQAERAELRALLAERCPPVRVRALEEDDRGFCPDLWDRLAGDGWLAAASMLDRVLRFEELGRAATPGPFLASLESQLVLRELDAGATGAEQRASLALLEASGSMDLSDLTFSCTQRKAGFALSGTKLFVPWADAARELLVVARGASRGGLSIFAVKADAAGVERTLLPSLGAERCFEVRMDEVQVGAAALVAENVGMALERALSRATLLACAELAGAAQASLELAVEHARTREQFGQPIAAFQAVAHHCANMAIDTDAVRLAVEDAAARVDAGEPVLQHASRAKIICSEAARRVTATAHQVMGGVGFLAEVDLQLHTRRVKGLESRLGTPDWHRERLADALKLQELESHPA